MHVIDESADYGASDEYTYEREGQIVVPAGAKAVGRIQEADRSGYVRIQFESLMMPDGDCSASGGRYRLGDAPVERQSGGKEYG